LWLNRHVKVGRYQPAVKWVFGMVRSLTLKMDINMGLWKEALRSCKEIDTPLLEIKKTFN
jgi:hypothetical protein